MKDASIKLVSNLLRLSERLLELLYIMGNVHCFLLTSWKQISEWDLVERNRMSTLLTEAQDISLSASSIDGWTTANLVIPTISNTFLKCSESPVIPMA